MNPNLVTPGSKHGRLTAIEVAPSDLGRNIRWRCKCDCGTEVLVRASSLRYGKTRSCGCLLRDSYKSTERNSKISAAKTTHGISRTPTWSSWSMMVQRCKNPKRKQYQDYGGRGIKPCQFVEASPLNVIALIGERQSKEFQIDRINNEGGYTCGQCEQCKANGWPMNIQWSTRMKQNRNKRSNYMITYNGETRCRAEWVQVLGKSIGWVRYHLG